MKLVLFGGGHAQENESVDDYLSKNLLKIKNPLITYIPSCSYYAQNDYIEFVEQYQRLGFRRILNFPIDGHIDQVMVKTILQSDMIHLSGGNTFSFLRNLRRSGLLQLLKQYVKKGGVLTGLSAGAIIMTPDILTASFPSFDRDENEVNLKNLKSMGLVKFSFFPHYVNSLRTDKEIFKYCKKLKNPLYAAKDGSAVIVENDKVVFVNKVYCFINNKKILINS